LHAEPQSPPRSAGLRASSERSRMGTQSRKCVLGLFLLCVSASLREMILATAAGRVGSSAADRFFCGDPLVLARQEVMGAGKPSFCRNPLEVGVWLIYHIGNVDSEVSDVRYARRSGNPARHTPNEPSYGVPAGRGLLCEQSQSACGDNGGQCLPRQRATDWSCETNPICRERAAGTEDPWVDYAKQSQSRGRGLDGNLGRAGTLVLLRQTKPIPTRPGMRNKANLQGPGNRGADHAKQSQIPAHVDLRGIEPTAVTRGIDKVQPLRQATLRLPCRRGIFCLTAPSACGFIRFPRHGPLAGRSREKHIVAVRVLVRIVDDYDN